MYNKDLLKNQRYLNYITNNHVKVFHYFFIISLFFPLSFSLKSNNTLGRQQRWWWWWGGHGALPMGVFSLELLTSYFDVFFRTPIVWNPCR